MNYKLLERKWLPVLFLGSLVLAWWWFPRPATRTLISQRSLSGFSKFLEALCPCNSPTIEDVALDNYATYSVVTSNVRKRNVWVNAIVAKPAPYYVQAWYRLSVSVRLPAIPKPDVNQQLNPEAVNLMLMLYLGDQVSREFPIVWCLNPWSPDYGQVLVYDDGEVKRTGVRLEPDTAWHRFVLAGDFASEWFDYMEIDGKKTSLSGFHMTKVAHPDWGADKNVRGTVETHSAYPQADCRYVFYWYVYVKDYRLETKT